MSDVAIKGGCGYYEIDRYPIGGSFHRAPAEGLKIREIVRTFERSSQTHGTDTIAILELSGKRIAVSSVHIERGSDYDPAPGYWDCGRA